VAFDDHLPGDFHGLRVDRVVHGVAVLVVDIEERAVVGMRNDELRVAEHVLGMRHLLQAQTVDGLDVGHGDHLVRLHDVQPDAGDAAVGLVIDDQILAVVLAIGHRQVRVVAVAVGEAGAVSHDPLALVGQTPAGRRVDVEYRNTHEFAHGGHTEHPYLSLVTAGPEAIVGIQLTGTDVKLGHGILLGRADRLGPALAGHARTAEGGGGHGCTGHGTSAEEAPAAHASGFRKGRRVIALVAHSQAP